MKNTKRFTIKFFKALTLHVDVLKAPRPTTLVYLYTLFIGLYVALQSGVYVCMYRPAYSAAVWGISMYV